MRIKLSVICTILAVLLPTPVPAQGIFGPTGSPPPLPYVAPNRLFSVTLPSGWAPRTFPDRPDFVELRLMDRPGTAWLQVQRSPVSEGARPRQLMARAVELRLKKLPHFNELLRRDVEIHGIKGASVLGTYWYQGNAQYPRAIEEVYIVLGKEAYELHFECFEPLSSVIGEDINRIYASFVPRPPSQSAMPPPEDDDDILDRIPF